MVVKVDETGVNVHGYLGDSRLTPTVNKLTIKGLATSAITNGTSANGKTQHPGASIRRSPKFDNELQL